MMYVRHGGKKTIIYNPFPQEIGELLQTQGKEYGVTTKRKRRCGWLDIPLLKYSNIINGYTALCLTKLDILDSLDEIKIAVSYKLDGNKIEHFPSSAMEVARLQVEYITLKGWQTCIADIRKYDDLPSNAQKYIETIQDYLGVPSE